MSTEPFSFSNEPIKGPHAPCYMDTWLYREVKTPKGIPVLEVNVREYSCHSFEFREDVVELIPNYRAVKFVGMPEWDFDEWKEHFEDHDLHGVDISRILFIWAQNEKPAMLYYP